MTEQPVGVREVAAYMNRSPYTIREWAKARKIPAHKPDGMKQWVFFLSEIRAEFDSAGRDSWALPSEARR